MADEVVQVKFDGGIAREGQLDFYEFSRSQYGLARFLATIEHFRRTGKVASRINARNYVELRVSAPRHGSFIQEVIIQATATVCATGFLALLAYIWHLISPRREKTDDTLLEIARTKLQAERQITAQARERTKQLQIVSNIANGTRASAPEAIELLKWSLKAYDRDSGVGKVQSESLPRVLNFVVPQNLRAELRDSILAAMKRNLVVLTCRRVLDDSDQPTSLILVAPIPNNGSSDDDDDEDEDFDDIFE